MLIRWLVTLPGELAQTRPARRAIETRADTVYVSLPVLAETVWVLARLYKLDRQQIARLVEALLANSEVVLQEAEAVADALAGFRAGGPGFADHLIGALNAAAGCTTTLTFDKAAARLDSFTEIT